MRYAKNTKETATAKVKKYLATTTQRIKTKTLKKVSVLSGALPSLRD